MKVGSTGETSEKFWAYFCRGSDNPAVWRAKAILAMPMTPASAAQSRHEDTRATLIFKRINVLLASWKVRKVSAGIRHWVPDRTCTHTYLAVCVLALKTIQVMCGGTEVEYRPVFQPGKLCSWMVHTLTKVFSTNPKRLSRSHNSSNQKYQSGGLSHLQLPPQT